MPSSTSKPPPIEPAHGPGVDAGRAAGSGFGRAARLRLGLGLALAVVILDQASKWAVLARLMDPPRAIEVLPIFNLVLVWNTGVSFGLFDSDDPRGAWILSAVALVIVAVLVVWLLRVPHRLGAAAIGLIVGGAVGNVVDRLRLGAVADFLDFHVGLYHWPAFNLADSAITVGVLILLYDALFARPESRK